jgi:hypothetical protein
MPETCCVWRNSDFVTVHLGCLLMQGSRKKIKIISEESSTHNRDWQLREIFVKAFRSTT